MNADVHVTDKITARAIEKAIESWRPDAVVLPLSPRLRRSLAEHIRSCFLLMAECAVNTWTVLPAHDDDREPAGHGIYIEGLEDEGWLIANLDSAMAQAVADLHNQERDSVMALFGEEG